MPSGSDTVILELEIEVGHLSKERAYTTDELHADRLGHCPEEDGTRHVINDFIWEMSIRTISTKVEDVSHKNL